ncbi:MAG TPA: DUF5076 domain-containing protein [Xanthobacteraceae bacterium]|nr:DUF5076 domain-containing protein [Xanthobacteraceae bacterium]
MPPPDDMRIYEALVIPNEALDRGGMEILRAGLVDDELYVTARRVFKDPATWGEILGEITQRLGRIYAAEGEYKAKEVIAAIENAFAAEMGAPIAAPRRKPATKRKPTARRKPARAKTRRANKRPSRKAR